MTFLNNILGKDPFKNLAHFFKSERLFYGIGYENDNMVIHTFHDKTKGNVSLNSLKIFLAVGENANKFTYSSGAFCTKGNRFLISLEKFLGVKNVNDVQLFGYYNEGDKSEVKPISKEEFVQSFNEKFLRRNNDQQLFTNLN